MISHLISSHLIPNKLSPNFYMTVSTIVEVMVCTVWELVELMVVMTGVNAMITATSSFHWLELIDVFCF
jgi:hypothetical protein